MKAKKSFGQHFLINESLARQLVHLAKAEANGLPVLEVGPGRAALTKYLIQEGMNFQAIDADQSMISYLQETYPAYSDRFERLNFLRMDLSSDFEGEECFILGNFPYNISSQILIHIVRHRAVVPKALGMFQKELAERIGSPPGNKTYGRISVMVQAFYKVKAVAKVSPGSFSPPPKVKSSVLLFERKRISLDCDESLFRQVVAISFSQRRKMLKNTIGHLVGQVDKNMPVFKNRPEKLSVQEFVDLTNLIQKER